MRFEARARRAGHPFDRQTGWSALNAGAAMGSLAAVLTVPLPMMQPAAAAPPETSLHSGDGANDPAASAPCRTRVRDNPAWMTLRVENDVAGGQDRGYTAGGFLEYQSPDLGTAEFGGCLPRGATAGIDHALRWLRPGGTPQAATGADDGFAPGLAATSHRTLRISIGQALYTPNDYALAEPIPDDRPFAATLALGLAYNASRLDTMWTTGLQLGVLGPSAGGRWTQSAMHRVLHGGFGTVQPLGWPNQLRDEFLAQLHHERLHRFDIHRGAGRWPVDVIAHYGANVGTVFRTVDVGLEWRTGPSLPADFGSSPMRPAGTITGAPRADGGQAPGWNLFASTGVRWVQHDATLDGNADGNGPSIGRRPLVAEFGVGISWHDGPWRVTFGEYARTFEFHGQQQWPVWGSLSISRALAW